MQANNDKHWHYSLRGVVLPTGRPCTPESERRDVGSSLAVFLFTFACLMARADVALGVGACCHADGTCSTAIDQAACEGAGGVYLGDTTACSGDSNGNFVDDSCEAIVFPGDDGWTTPPGGGEYDFANAPVPADFFDLGSDPFTGLLELGGDSLATTPAAVIEPIDTIARRTAPTTNLDLGPSTVPLQLIALRLVSAVPIVVTFNGGQQPEFWDVEVCLSNASQTPGFMTITKTNPDGGTFEVTNWGVVPLFRFTRQSDSAQRVLDCGAPQNQGLCDDVLLDTVQNNTWVLIGGPGNIQRSDFAIREILPGILVDTDCTGFTTGVATTIGSSRFQGGLTVVTAQRRGGASAECKFAQYVLSLGGFHTVLFASTLDANDNGIADACEGACCHSDLTCDDDADESGCDGGGDDFQGPGTECMPEGACCLGIVCQEGVAESCCLVNGGRFLGVGADCTADGACCLSDPNLPTEQLCIMDPCCQELGGTEQGNGTTCDPERACCLPEPNDFDQLCVVIAEECCDELGGTLANEADGQNDCLPISACCLGNGECIETTRECCENAGGTYQEGPGGTPIPCNPLGGCCMPGGACVDTSATCCGMSGGVFHGDNSSCGASGACCLAGGLCQNTAELCCGDVAGEFHGQGSSCAGDVDSNGIDDTCDGQVGIPTVSHWGMFALTLLVLTAGCIVLRRRRTVRS